MPYINRTVIFSQPHEYRNWLPAFLSHEIGMIILENMYLRQPRQDT